MSTPITAHAQDQDIYPFLTHVGAMRQRAREHIKDGTSMANEAADRATLVGVLNAALATELMCVQRYRELSALGRQGRLKAELPPTSGIPALVRDGGRMRRCGSNSAATELGGISTGPHLYHVSH